MLHVSSTRVVDFRLRNIGSHECHVKSLRENFGSWHVWGGLTIGATERCRKSRDRFAGVDVFRRMKVTFRILWSGEGLEEGVNGGERMGEWDGEGHS